MHEFRTVNSGPSIQNRETRTVAVRCSALSGSDKSKVTMYDTRYKEECVYPRRVAGLHILEVSSFATIVVQHSVLKLQRLEAVSLSWYHARSLSSNVPA